MCTTCSVRNSRQRVQNKYCVNLYFIRNFYSHPTLSLRIPSLLFLFSFLPMHPSPSPSFSLFPFPLFFFPLSLSSPSYPFSCPPLSLSHFPLSLSCYPFPSPFPLPSLYPPPSFPSNEPYKLERYQVIPTTLYNTFTNSGGLNKGHFGDHLFCPL